MVREPERSESRSEPAEKEGDSSREDDPIVLPPRFFQRLLALGALLLAIDFWLGHHIRQTSTQ